MSGEAAEYDCGIIGGGVAGLCLSIQLARLGRRVIVFEKGGFPFHKVCGEYVSNESAGFFLRLGLKLGDWDLPQINTLGITSGEGYLLNARLGLGGFGISRYKLDAELAALARREGVSLLENTRVHNAAGQTIVTSKGDFSCMLTVGAFGKSRPAFTRENNTTPTESYVGVKYHIRSDLPPDRIELHNFSGGYCGISRVEDDKYCLCYLTNARNLRRYQSDIGQMEEKVLMKNPRLKKIFNSAAFINERPITTSNITFGERRTSDSDLLFVGDAAGCISPLTGNGMSMSGYSSTVLASLIHAHLSGDITGEALRSNYRESWKSAFSTRIKRGRQLQYIFGKPYLSDLALRMLNPMNRMKNRLIAATHGIPY